MMVKGAKALEVWCRRVTDGYPGVEVTNMTTSWKDGLAFCAILHRYRPDIIDFHKLDKKDIKGNNFLAFKMAEEAFGIPQLLDPEDMAKCVAPDRLSILTYMSEIYHKLKNLQPRGSPIMGLDQQSMLKASRTSSTSSSGVTSLASSCESSASSICDSPPPSGASTASRKDSPPAVGSLDPPIKVAEIESRKEDSKDVDEDKDPKKDVDPEANNQVVLRNKGKSTESQRRALATRRRLVQSMIVESSSGMSSLCSPSPSPPSPAIEKENPFREAMMKFAELEKEDERKKKVLCTKWTETTTPTRDSKSTQTIPSFVANNSNSPARVGEDRATFRTCLRSQSSCPPTTATPTRPRAPSTGPLSYTSTPKPYSSQSQSTSALHKSLSSICSPQHNPLSVSLTHAFQKHQSSRSQSSSSNRRPLSMLMTPKAEPVVERHSKSMQSKGGVYTPQHVYYQNPYSNNTNTSSNWSTTSLYVTPISSTSSPSSGYGSSVYTTPIGGSPCRNSRYSDSPTIGSSPMRYRSMAYPQNHQLDRLQLHIEGQSSLV